MGTPFVHTLLPFDTYEADSAGDIEGTGQALLGRTRWTYTLEVAEVTSVTVVIQAAAVDDDDEYATVGTFNSGAISAVGTHTLTAPTDFTVQPYYEWHRAKVTAQTGDATIRVTAAGPFVDPARAPDTKTLLSAELRGWEDGLARTVEQAERDVRALLLHRNHAEAGVLDVYGTAEAVYDEVRAMVADQAEWRLKRAMLAREKTATSADQLRRMPILVPGLTNRVRLLRRKDTAFWRGR